MGELDFDINVRALVHDNETVFYAAVPKYLSIGKGPTARAAIKACLESIDKYHAERVEPRG